MQVHLVDATYELFRAFFGAPARSAPDGREVGAVRGLLGSMLYLVQDEGATHVACIHADGQYSPEVLPALLAAQRARGLDLLQGSRIASGTVRTRPHGTPAACSRSISASSENAAKASSSARFNSGRCATRS